MAEKKRHSNNDGWQLHAAAGKKRMAEKKEKKGAKLTDEGNRTRPPYHYTASSDYILYIQSVWCFNSDKKEAWGVARFELRSR